MTTFVHIDRGAPRYFRLKDGGVFKVVTLSDGGSVLTCGPARRELLVPIVFMRIAWQDDRLVIGVETEEFERILVVRLVKDLFQISRVDVPVTWQPVTLLGDVVYFDNMDSRCAKLNLLTNEMETDFETGNLATFAERESLSLAEHSISMAAVTASYAVYEMVRLDNQRAVVIVPNFDFDRAFVVYWRGNDASSLYADENSVCLVYEEVNSAYILSPVEPGRTIELIPDNVHGHFLNYLVLDRGIDRIALFNLKTKEFVAQVHVPGFGWDWLECEDLTGLVWVARGVEVSFLPGLRVVNWAATEGKVTIKDLPEVLGRRIYGMVEARSLTGLVVGIQTVNVQAMIV